VAHNLLERKLDDLTIEDEDSFRHVGLYADLKAILRKDGFVFRLLPADLARWDHALLLNLTFWAESAAGDILVDEYLDADVLAHAAWHHLAARNLRNDQGKLSAEALLLGEAVASAFDLYLVGRLLGRSVDSLFLGSQVPAMTEVAENAGLSRAEIEAMLREVERAPERAFEDLRQLLYDTALALLHAKGADAALAVLAGTRHHRFGALLHRYELSNWVLATRLHTPAQAAPDVRVRTLEAGLRQADDSLAWLTQAWVEPALRTVPR